MKNIKKAKALETRIKMIGDLNDKYRELIEMQTPELGELRKLAYLYKENKMPGRAETIMIEVAVLEHSRKFVPNKGIIESVNNSGYGGTNENPETLQSVGIPCDSGAGSDSLLGTTV